ncbi:hypothetical protein [Arthrobacter sp. B3I4]|uniref:hypothetical protein n=1 Tax=Arthrobacter sp. B3I4 TaxID=3042267 RepID=UPI00277EDBF9|nr:hypothetical protein [Arthrobacter sp. B3I4]MDQ0755036.1 putative membrane protein [Arthrobacter sp. B3I4]
MFGAFLIYLPLLVPLGLLLLITGAVALAVLLIKFLVLGLVSLAVGLYRFLARELRTPTQRLHGGSG